MNSCCFLRNVNTRQLVGTQANEFPGEGLRDDQYVISPAVGCLLFSELRVRRAKAKEGHQVPSDHLRVEFCRVWDMGGRDVL